MVGGSCIYCVVSDESKFDWWAAMSAALPLHLPTRPRPLAPAPPHTLVLWKGKVIYLHWGKEMLANRNIIVQTQDCLTIIILLLFKVHLTPKYFFCSNKSLHLFEAHCAFLPRFNPNLDFLQAVKVTKSGHYLLHDRASKGYGSIPGWTSQTDLHRIKSL